MVMYFWFYISQILPDNSKVYCYQEMEIGLYYVSAPKTEIK